MRQPEINVNIQPSSKNTTEDLRNELLATMDLLDRRRADLVSEARIADYVNLNWLEWNGGTLRLTETGRNVCQQMRASSR